VNLGVQLGWLRVRLRLRLRGDLVAVVVVSWRVLVVEFPDLLLGELRMVLAVVVLLTVVGGVAALLSSGCGDSQSHPHDHSHN
jgi:hypothetical protein